MSSSPFPSLDPYGWNSSIHLPSGTTPARVIRHDGSTLTVQSPTGPEVVANTVRIEPPPTVGDWLALQEGRIVEVLPRTSLLRRLLDEANHVQSLAANVDVVLITCGADRPVKRGRIHRSVTVARDAGAVAVVVITKVDTGITIDIAAIAREHPGIRIIAVSAIDGTGLDEVREAIGGGTAVLLGESGAGKSTLANALIGAADATTGRVRTGDAKGRHTTTSRQLRMLPGGGVIIDTPGIRSVGLYADPAAVDESFAEIAELAHGCRFGDCRHDSEPGCAVRDALDSGDLDPDRFASWRHLQREVAASALRADPAATRRRGKQFSRAAKLGAARKGR